MKLVLEDFSRLMSVEFGEPIASRPRMALHKPVRSRRGPPASQHKNFRRRDRSRDLELRRCPNALEQKY